ncbi:MAG: type II toxin-antitoxin system PemK/MazF family toxin [Balneolales bacterium]
MIKPNRGQVWDITFIDHGENSTLPFLVLSDDLLNNSAAGIVIILPVIYDEKGIRSHIKASLTGVEPIQYIYVCCEEIVTVSVDRCHQLVGSITQKNMDEISYTVKMLLGL